MTAEGDSTSLVHPEWKLYIDGASRSQGSGAGIILIGPNKIRIRYAVKLKYSATKNAAEYEALITRLKLAIEVRAENLKVYSDSQLVVNQVKYAYQVKEPSIIKYVQKAKQLLKKRDQEGGQWDLLQIPRSENSEADSLAKATAENNKAFQELELTEELVKPSTKEEEVMNIQDIAEWMKPIIQYIEHGTLPEDKLQARKLRVKAAHYSIHNGELYRRSLSHPWSKCVSPEEGDYVLREIHEGICGAHEAQNTLVWKALLQGYYWPSMSKDAFQLVQR